ncbi:MAG: hypothetical protein K6G44_11765 [Lentisphaeria bacterium]|nr:hypothetical protein [Lentisphaeria bacterium]
MKLFKKRSRLFWSLLLSAFVMVCLNVRAADDDDEEEEEGETDWHVERAKLEAEVERSVQKRLDREVTEEKVINGLSRTIPQLGPWTSPVKAPELTKDEVEEELMKEIMKEVKVKFPESRREEFKGEAEEKYKMWKRNDDVEFVIREGIGSDTTVKGKLQEVSSERVKVYPRRTINVRDLSDETKARLYKVFHDKEVEEYVANENRRYDVKIDAYKLDEKEKRIPDAYLKSGYIPNLATIMENGAINKRRLALRMTSPNPEHWVARKDYVNDLYKQLREEAGARMKDEEANRVFKAKGYMKVNKKTFKKLIESGMPEDDVSGWMPRAEYNRLQQEQREMIENERAQQGGGGGEPGEGGMMPPEMSH